MIEQPNFITTKNKLPIPFLKDVNYIDYNGNMKTIKGFLGSVKNVKAINENDNYLQPFKIQDGRYLNPQISLSTFFVDKNNVIYGDFFHGTKHSKFTQLFPISQSEIQPLFHKKRDIQFDIARNPILEKSGENNAIATKTKTMVGEDYNIITQDNNNTDNSNADNKKPKIKSVSPNENVLETVYKKYLKFNKNAYDAFAAKIASAVNNGDSPIFNRFNNKHANISDLQKPKFICLDGVYLFNVNHDELLAVPKDKDYKTHFDCAIIIKLPSNIEDTKQILTTQAKCGYPYVIIYQDDNEVNQANTQPYKPPKLQYKLMSHYISDLEDTYAKTIEQARDRLQKLDTKDFFYKSDKYACEKGITTYQQLIENIKTDPDIQQFLKYEKQQINYIISKKSKSFNCSNKLLKQCMQKISKTDNEAEQLNYLINYENEIKEEVQKQKALAKKLRINIEDLWVGKTDKHFNAMLNKIIINNTLGISVKEFNKILKEKFKAKTNEEKMAILATKSKELKQKIEQQKIKKIKDTIKQNTKFNSATISKMFAPKNIVERIKPKTTMQQVIYSTQTTIKANNKNR